MNGQGWTGTLNDAAGEISRNRGKALIVVLGFWTLVGLVTAFQSIAGGRLTGEAIHLPGRVGQGLAAGILWVPLTFLIVELHGRFPLEGRGRRRALAVHVAGCVAVPLLYNLLYWLLRSPGAPPDVIARGAARSWLAYLHLSGAVYWAILAADRWRRRQALSASSLSYGLTSIPVRSGQRVHVVDVRSVTWIEGAGDYARLHTDDGSFLASKKLGDLAARLDPRRFLRIHRSTIVDMERVRRYRPLGHGDYRVTLDDGTTLTVSRTRGREFRRWLERCVDPGRRPYRSSRPNS